MYSCRQGRLIAQVVPIRATSQVPSALFNGIRTSIQSLDALEDLGKGPGTNELRQHSDEVEKRSTSGVKAFRVRRGYL